MVTTIVSTSLLDVEHMLNANRSRYINVKVLRSASSHPQKRGLPDTEYESSTLNFLWGQTPISLKKNQNGQRKECFERSNCEFSPLVV